MNKISLIILLAIFALSATPQIGTGKWDDSTARYTNSKLGISWQLLDDFEWKERPIIMKSTILKVRNYDTNIVVSLSVTNFSGECDDIWNYNLKEEIQQSEKLYKQQAKNAEMSYLGTKRMKSQICGVHALKTYVDMKKYYSEYQQDVHCIEITYSFAKDNHIFTASVMGVSVLEEEIRLFEKLATQLFKGITIK